MTLDNYRLPYIFRREFVMVFVQPYLHYDSVTRFGIFFKFLTESTRCRHSQCSCCKVPPLGDFKNNVMIGSPYSEMSVFRHHPSEGGATQANFLADLVVWPGLCDSALAWTMTK